LAVQPRAAFRTPQKTAKYGVMTAADFNAPPAAIPLPPVDRWNPQSCGDSAMRIHLLIQMQLKFVMELIMIVMV
jgi:hypothetical protein